MSFQSLFNLPPALFLLTSLLAIHATQAQTSLSTRDHPRSGIKVTPDLNLINVTIDDETGDDKTGLKPVYSTTMETLNVSNWRQGKNCEDCFGRPDPTRAHGGTWHEGIFIPGGGGTGPTSVTLKFNGSAIYVYFILMNNLPDLGALYSLSQSNTNLSFTIDNSEVPAGPNFIYTAQDTTDYKFGVLVFNKTFPDIDERSLRITTSDMNTNATSLFDYAEYSTIDPTNPTFSTIVATKKPSTGAIVGGVIAGLVGLASICLAFFFYRKRHSRYNKLSGSDDYDASHPNAKAEKTITPFLELSSPQLQDDAPAVGRPGHRRSGSSGIRPLALPMQVLSGVKPHHDRKSSKGSGSFRPSPGDVNLGEYNKTANASAGRVHSHVVHVEESWPSPPSSADSSSQPPPSSTASDSTSTLSPPNSSHTADSRRSMNTVARQRKAQLRREDLERRMQEMIRQQQEAEDNEEEPGEELEEELEEEPGTSLMRRGDGSEDAMTREMQALKYEIDQLKKHVVTAPPPEYMA